MYKPKTDILHSEEYWKRNGWGNQSSSALKECDESINNGGKTKTKTQGRKQTSV